MPGNVMMRWSQPGSNTIGFGSKKARRIEAAIVFVDETSFSFLARTATIWAPIGRTPILRRVSKRRKFSTEVGLTLSGRIYKRHFARVIHGNDVVVALHHFQQHIPGPLSESGTGSMLIALLWSKRTSVRTLRSTWNGFPFMPRI
jgi:hypothetical protein